MFREATRVIGRRGLSGPAAVALVPAAAGRPVWRGPAPTRAPGPRLAA